MLRLVPKDAKEPIKFFGVHIARTNDGTMLYGEMQGKQNIFFQI